MPVERADGIRAVVPEERADGLQAVMPAEPQDAASVALYALTQSMVRVQRIWCAVPRLRLVILNPPRHELVRWRAGTQQTKRSPSPEGIHTHE